MYSPATAERDYFGELGAVTMTMASNGNLALKQVAAGPLQYRTSSHIESYLGL